MMVDRIIRSKSHLSELLFIALNMSTVTVQTGLITMIIAVFDLAFYLAVVGIVLSSTAFTFSVFVSSFSAIRPSPSVQLSAFKIIYKLPHEQSQFTT
jgi:hypothetical protein